MGIEDAVRGWAQETQSKQDGQCGDEVIEPRGRKSINRNGLI